VPAVHPQPITCSAMPRRKVPVRENRPPR
jgi:hypothetical protein